MRGEEAKDQVKLYFLQILSAELMLFTEGSTAELMSLLGINKQDALLSNLYGELENSVLNMNDVVRRCTLYIQVFTVYSLLQSTRVVV